MSMTIPVTVAKGEVEPITKKKLMEDLKTVVADAEELLKEQLPTRPGNGSPRPKRRRRNR